jgi:alkylation response protein AidB-like acyl-CoA dehydrogenase
MSQLSAAIAPPPQPLVSLTDDEILFRDNVRQFADQALRPKVREMDEQGVFDQSLIDQFFHLGLMGIEVPEQYGGAGGKFFEAILAVEETSRVDPSAGVIVDVQNTLVNNALMRWGNDEQKRRYLPRMTSNTVGAYALSEAGSGSDAFAMQTRAQLKGSEYVFNGRSSGSPTAKRRACSSCLPRWIPRRDTRESRHSSWKKAFRDSAWARKKISWASALRLLAS